MTTAERRWWGLAWLCLVLAVPLRLAFFAGFGLGDDPNESIAIYNFAHDLRLNPIDFMHYRVVNVVMRGLLYRLFGVNELAFVLPVLAFALATHALTLVLARELRGPRFACFTSLLFLVTPYETLASTANVPDYFHAFFGVAATWAVLRGYRQESGRWMALGALAIVLALLNRLMAILFVPPFVIATLVTLPRWRQWVSFWATLTALIGLVCLWDAWHSGGPFRWIVYNSAGTGGGYNVTSILRIVLLIYPRYLFALDDHGNRMFAFTGWCAAFGATWAFGRLVLRRGGTAESVLVLAFFVFVGLFEFLPHKLSLTAYWSHPRIFRYLAAVVPVQYLCGAYLLESLSQVRAVLGALACAALVATGLYWTPRVAEPLIDASRDGRHLMRVLAEQPKTVAIYADYWRTTVIGSRLIPPPPLNGVQPDSKDDKIRFLGAVPPGALVVTGGATLPWYSGIELIINLSTLHFSVPEDWLLIDEYDGPRRPWRVEPLRVWRVLS